MYLRGCGGPVSGACGGQPKSARRSHVPKMAVFRTQNIMAKAPASSSTDATPASYEDALQELEQLVSRLESGDMPLEQLLSAYQRGALLLQFCRDKLQAVESQISVLDAGTLKTWMPE